MFRTTPARRLSVECLEARHLQAGLVTLSLTNEAWVIKGDGAANGIEIRQSQPHEYLIQGLDYGGGATALVVMDSSIGPARLFESWGALWISWST